MLQREAPGSPSYLVRHAAASDLPAIFGIYHEAVLTSTATFDTEPYSEERQRQWLLAHRHPYVVLVAECDGDVVGWASLSPFSAKPGYRYTAENSVYVRADMRGAGVGRLLLVHLLDAARANGFRTVIARITGENEVSLRLHRSLGFQHAGVEREVGYKFDRWLDVVTLQHLLHG